MDATTTTNAVLQSGLLEQAASALEHKLANNPDDAKTLEILGQIYRKQGNLEAAAAIYTQLRDVTPCHPTAAYLAAILTGQMVSVSEPTAQPWPAPFIRIANFLPQTQRAQLLTFARNHKREFTPSPVYTRSEAGDSVAHYDPAIRQQRSLHGNPELEELILPHILPHLLTHLPSWLPRLQLAPFSIGTISVQLALSQHSHYGQAHCDATSERIKVNCVYYFHTHPKAFDGGDLLLYDTTPQQSAFDRACFTRILPHDNTLLVFPGLYYHAITQVTCRSEAFDAGRFALAVHISPEAESQ